MLREILSKKLRRDDLPKSIQESTDLIEAKVKDVKDDVKAKLVLMESKMKVSEIELSMKITMAEGNLGKKIDENSTRLSNVEGTLTELLKAQKEQNESNKVLTDSLITNFLGDAKKGEGSGGVKEQRSATGYP
ncbi:hypothetical protein Dimus_005625 [Dionaea muscipula]